MRKEKQSLTEGVLGKQILWFSVPLMFSNVLQILFNMADIAVVGQFAGALSLASVGSTTILVALFTGILIGMSSGINVLTAKYLRAENEQGVEETVHSAAIISSLTGLLILLIGVGCSPMILRLMNTRPELLEGAVLYVRIYFLGMPALAVYNLRSLPIFERSLPCICSIRFPGRLQHWQKFGISGKFIKKR